MLPNNISEAGLTLLFLLFILITTEDCKNIVQGRYYYYNHSYNKILKSDWLSTALISALIGQLNRTVRVMPKSLDSTRHHARA